MMSNRRQRCPICFDALRRSRAVVVVLALLGLFCAQTALAFYRCPQLSISTHEQAKPPCAQMDMESPALCKAFVQGDTPGLDGPRFALDLDSAGLVHTGLPVLVVPAVLERAPRPRFEQPRAGPPPLLWIWFGRFRD
jgi:hypothetical protein